MFNSRHAYLRGKSTMQFRQRPKLFSDHFQLLVERVQGCGDRSYTVSRVKVDHVEESVLRGGRR